MSDERTLLFVLLFLALLNDVAPNLPVRKGIGSRRRIGSGHVTGYGGSNFGRPCTRSSDCDTGNPRDVSCCTDVSTGLVIDPDLGRVEILLGSRPQGRCTRSKSGPDQFCNLRCGCSRGRLCYRRQTGFCCAPRTCLTRAEVKEDMNRPPPP